MAQRRMLSKSISVSIQVQKLSLKTRLLFTWIIAHADDLGLLPYNARVLKAIVLPMSDDFNVTDIEKGLKEILDSGLMEVFDYNDQRYYQLINFFTYQTLKKDRKPQTLLGKIEWREAEQLGFQVESTPFGNQTEDTGTPKIREVKLREERECAPHPQKKEKPNKKPAKKKEVSEEVKRLHKEAVELIDFWRKKYEDSMGQKPIISAWARYIKQAKPFIKTLGLPRMKMLCEGYFATFDDKLFKSSGWSINVFLIDSTINKLQKKYS